VTVIPYWLVCLGFAAICYVATQFVIWLYREATGEKRTTVEIVIKGNAGGYQPKGSMSNAEPPGAD